MQFRSDSIVSNKQENDCAFNYSNNCLIRSIRVYLYRRHKIGLHIGFMQITSLDVKEFKKVFQRISYPRKIVLHEYIFSFQTLAYFSIRTVYFNKTVVMPVCRTITFSGQELFPTRTTESEFERVQGLCEKLNRRTFKVGNDMSVREVCVEWSVIGVF